MLPLATYLFRATWIITTTNPLKFTIVYENYNLRDSTCDIKPPIGLPELDVSCAAYDDYLYPPASFSNESKFETEDPSDDLNDSFKISKIVVEIFLSFYWIQYPI